MYETGSGSVKMRASYIKEDGDIVIEALPYQTSGAKVVTQIASQMRDKKLPLVDDIRDESDRHGMRVVIELRRDAQPSIVLNNLYRHTSMRSSFNTIMLALVDGLDAGADDLGHVARLGQRQADRLARRHAQAIDQQRYGEDRATAAGQTQRQAHDRAEDDTQHAHTPAGRTTGFIMRYGYLVMRQSQGKARYVTAQHEPIAWQHVHNGSRLLSAA